MRRGGSGEDVDLFDIGDSDSGPGLCHCYFYPDNFTLERVTPIYMMERMTPTDYLQGVCINCHK